MNMKRTTCLLLAVLTLCLLLTACAGEQPAPETDGAAQAQYAQYNELRADDSGTLTIETAGITRDATYFNYDAEGVTVQLVALRDQDGGVHIAFNTCQSCSPSPKAYYQQSGELLRCTNCGFTFEPEEVGVTQGGCNPWPIEGVSVGKTEITIPAASLDAMRDTFTFWGGPSE